MTEPPVKIVMLRVTSANPDVSMEEFTSSLKLLLTEMSLVKNVNVMTQHFAVDGDHVQVHQWMAKQEEAAPVPTDPEEINARLKEFAEFASTLTESSPEQRQELLPRATGTAFVLKKFAAGVKDPEHKAMAEGLRTKIMTWVTP